MSLIPFIALRFLKTGSRRHFPFLTAISVMGVTLSVFSFVVIHSVMNGFASHIRGALIGFNAHVTITLPEEDHLEAIRKWWEGREEVAGVSLVSELSGVIEVPDGGMAGVKIRGIDPGEFFTGGSLEIHLFDEGRGGLEPSGGRGGMVIGEELFIRLGLTPSGRIPVNLLIPVGDVGPTGEIEPAVGEFAATGVFSTGFYEQDSRYVLIARHEADRLSSLTKVRELLFVRLRDPDASFDLSREFRKKFPGIPATPWQERDRRVLAALKLEKTAMILLLSIITAIASFGILGLTTLLTLRRLKDLSLLSALGLPDSSVGKIPILTGSLVGLVGTLIGFAVGGASILYLAKNPPLLPPAYYVDFLPVKADPMVLGVVFVMAPLLAMAASLWPARRLGKMATVELLRST